MTIFDFQVPDSRQVRYIIHTDCKNEADDQFALAHCLLTPSFQVKGIIAGHFDQNYGRFAPGQSAKASYDEVLKVLSFMPEFSDVPVFMGADTALEVKSDPIVSEGVQFIIDEAMKDDPRPLYIGMQGCLTDLASAILIEPRICQRMTAIWIGGGAYPEGGQEFNLMQDIKAANIVFESDMPLWQVPSDVYKSFAVSLAELQYRVAPQGPLGAYLFKQMVELNLDLGKAMPDFDWPHGELWGLGDQGVLAALMHEQQRTDLYQMVPAPRIDEETMAYQVIEGQERFVRVYRHMDVRLTLEDFYAKLALYHNSHSED
ncbi:nucleoside hydrolase [Streptococcus moroccensis]|uniref:Inosine-uridine nucleoside N-ribohydrolase n=1 Tax=Streptococcus moroccensis TaxID=1451356 RepID=A0ABT9YT74_9STRE|nr:nucleoside hydrolase [Streptococcus moroccensis]MDQ0223196.1 inosine-uridine nucleoside N-ribohydrolase [Streptococcus moroccensis]